MYLATFKQYFHLR